MTNKSLKNNFATKTDVDQIVNKAVKKTEKVLRSEILRVEEKVENVEDRLGNVEDRLGSVEGKVDVVDKKLDNLQNTLDSFLGRIDNLETDNEVGAITKCLN